MADYTKNDWTTGDLITAAKLDNLETQYDTAKSEYQSRAWGVPRESADYIIYKDGSTYYAQNGSTGVIDSSNSEASVVFQYAGDHLPTEGGLIGVKTGTYDINTQVTLPAGAFLQGYNAILELDSLNNTGFVFNSGGVAKTYKNTGMAGFHVTGTITNTSTWVAQVLNINWNVHFENMTTYGCYNGYKISDATWLVEFNECVVKYFGGYGIYLDTDDTDGSANGVFIINCCMESGQGTEYGIYSSASSYNLEQVTITGFKCENLWKPIYLESSSTVIKGSVISGHPSASSGVIITLHQGTSSLAGHRNIISNNVIEGFAVDTYVIHLDHTYRNTTISDNIIVSRGPCIYTANENYLDCTGNTFQSIADANIIEGKFAQSVITGNNFWSNGDGTAIAGVYNVTESLVITGNNFYNLDEAITEVKRSTITGNLFQNISTYVASATDSTFSGNTLYNCGGAMTFPTGVFVGNRLDTVSGNISVTSGNFSDNVFVSYSGTLTLTSSVVNNNTGLAAYQPFSQANYIIYKSGSTYYAKNGATGVVDSSSSLFSTVMQYCCTALNSVDGGLIAVMQGTYVFGASDSTINSYCGITIRGYNAYIDATACDTLMFDINPAAVETYNHVTGIEGFYVLGTQDNTNAIFARATTVVFGLAFRDIHCNYLANGFIIRGSCFGANIDHCTIFWPNGKGIQLLNHTTSGPLYWTPNDVTISDCAIEHAKAASNSYAVYILGDVKLIERCAIRNCCFENMKYSIYDTGQHTVIDGCKISTSADSGAYGITVATCGGISYSGYDCTIVNNVIYTQTTNTAGVIFSSAYVTAVINDNTFRDLDCPAIYSTVEIYPVITGNFFDMNAASQKIIDAKIAYGTIVGNHFYGVGTTTDISFVSGSAYNTISGNNFEIAANAITGCNGDAITGNHFTTIGTVICSGTNVAFVGNSVAADCTGTIAPTTSVIGDNKGYVNKAAGTANFTASATLVITHGLVTTPTKVLVTGSDTNSKALWITTIGATQFTINRDNSTGTPAVYWYAEV